MTYTPRKRSRERVKNEYPSAPPVSPYCLTWVWGVVQKDWQPCRYKRHEGELCKLHGKKASA